MRPSTSSSSSSSNTTAAAATMDKNAQHPVAYEFEPPAWRPSLHPTARLPRVPDLFPTRPGQAEDEFTQTTVRNGFSGSFGVVNETLLAHEIMQDLLQTKGVLRDLGFCLHEVLQRRDDLERDRIAASQHKPPSRVTLNDTKLANYVKDLADPEVPLHRLARSVPHGFKGEKMFEMLWSGGGAASTATNTAAAAAANISRNHLASRVAASAAAAMAATAANTANAANASPQQPQQPTHPPRASVDIARAVWFVRAVGAAELQSVRSKSSAVYASEMTASLCSWLNKQVGELSCTASTAGTGATLPNALHGGIGGGTPATAATIASPATPSPGYFQPRTPQQRPSMAPTPPAWQQQQQQQQSTPSAAHAAATVKDRCAVLQDPVEEERWTSKWAYSLSLVRHLNSQHLLDRPTLLRWIIEALHNSNLAQIWFLVELVDEVVELVLQRRFVALPLVTAVCVKLSQLDGRYNRDAVAALRQRLCKILLLALEAAPEAFVSPRLWHDHRGTLVEAIASGCAEDAARRKLLEVRLRCIEIRTGKLSLASWIRVPGGADGRAAATITATAAAVTTTNPSTITTAHGLRALDALDLYHPAIVALLSPPEASNRPVADRIEVVLTWACTDRRRGIHRQYVAASLIERLKYGEQAPSEGEGEGNGDPSSTSWLNGAPAQRRGKKRRSKVNVEPALLKWLGDVEAATIAAASSSTGPGPPRTGRSELLASCETGAIIVLFGELARRGLFSYSRFLQRLVARGVTMPSLATGASGTGTGTDIGNGTPNSNGNGTNALRTTEISTSTQTAQSNPQGSLQLRLLRALPLYEEESAILQQRRLAIYGHRSKETYEEANERRALRELRQLLPWLFDDVGEPPPLSNGSAPSSSASSSLTAAPPPLQVSGGEEGPLSIGDERKIRAALPHLWNASRYVRIRLFRYHLLPRAATCKLDGLSRQRFCLLTTVMAMGQDFESLLQLMVTVLMRPLPETLAKTVLDLLIEHHAVWRGLDALPTLATLVRRQLNHASSTRNVRLAVLASNALQRLKQMQPPSPLEPPPAERAPAILDPGEVQMAQETYRRLGFAGIEGRGHGHSHGRGRSGDDVAAVLAALRQLFARSDASVDETIEVAIVECLTEPGADPLLDLAVELLDLLHREASTEIDERHACWLASLAAKLAVPDVSPSLVEPSFRLVARLVTLGVASLAVVVKHLLLPLVASLVQAVADPSTSGVEAVPMLLRCRSLLARLMLLEEVSHEDEAALDVPSRQSLKAQRALLFAPGGFDALVRLTALLRVAAQTASASVQAPSPTSATSMPSPAPPVTGLLFDDELLPIETLCQQLLELDQMQSAFYRDPRAFFRAVRETTRSVWGSDGRKVLDGMVKAMDPSSLLLQDLGSIDGNALRRRLDGWHPATCELVDVFGRLQAAESSFQVRAESKIKSFATALYRDLFLHDPAAGRELLEDAASTSLAASFVDEGLRAVLRSLQPEATTAAAAEPAMSDDLGAAFGSIQVIVGMQKTFTIAATDTETATHLLQRVVVDLESVAASADLDQAQDVGATLGVLYLLLRLSCLWTSTNKASVAQLCSSLLALSQRLGIHEDHEAQLELVLDTLSYVLDEVPPTVLALLSGELDAQMEAMRLLHPRAALRMGRQLLNLDHVNPTRDLVLAPSVSLAVQRGWYTVDAPKPWDCQEYVEPPAGPTTTTTTTTAAGGGGAVRLGASRSTQASGRSVATTPTVPTDARRHAQLPGARQGWPSRLETNTSLPLTLFDGRVTRDVVPTFAAVAGDAEGSEDGGGARGVPEHLESERTYGDYRAGEPIYARDVRRGLVRLPSRAQPRADKGPSTVGSRQGSAGRATRRAAERITIDLTGDDDDDEGEASSRRVGVVAVRKRARPRDEGNATEWMEANGRKRRR
ncbi:RNA polymerase II mediator complex subunit [Thecaphora frezii]